MRPRPVPAIVDYRIESAQSFTQVDETQEFQSVPSQTRPAYLQDVRGIDLEVTSACSADCTFCPRDEVPDTHTFISLDTVNRLADDLRQYDERKEVILCGVGESTLHPELTQIVDTLNRAGALVQMTTHGAHLTTKKFVELVQHGIVEFHFSINAATAETHRRIMRLKVFDRIVENLLQILEIQSVDYPHVPICVSFVVCEANEHEVDDFVDFWRDKGVRQIWLHPTNNRAGLVAPDAKSVQMRQITERYAEDDLVVVDVFGGYEEQDDLCKVARSMIFISAEGQIRLCALDYRRATDYGNLADKHLHEMHADKLMECLLGRNDGMFCGCDFCPPVIRDRAVPLGG